MRARARGRLMQAAVAALAAPRCSEASRGAVLDVLELVLDLGEDAADAVLRPHTAPLLGSLRGLVAAAAARGGGGGGGGGGRKRGSAVGKARAGPALPCSRKRCCLRSCRFE